MSSEVIVPKRRFINFWLRMSSLILAFSLLLVFAAALIGHGMGKRVLAMLSANTAQYWQIDLLEVDRGLQHPLTYDNNRYGFMWSPDGQHIGFSSDADGFVVMDWTGRDPRPMADSDFWMKPFAQGISSYDTEWNDAKTERVFRTVGEIYICDVDCTHRQRITVNDGYYDASPSWSPDGQRIVFASDRGGIYVEIFIMHRDGSAMQQLTRMSSLHKWTPDWSSDGRQITFIGTLGKNGEVFVMDSNGQNLRRVTYNQSNDANPAWQPG